ncbi:MAG TPA: hypothetical protein VJL81_02390 [Solirubrobacterales bacterium]|nr:hypothetical protein [Solirubrobacterales bacterium]
MAFLVALIGLGLLGVPALLVAAIGIGAAAFGIALFHRRLEASGTAGHRRSSKRSPMPARYVPSVLEGSSMRRRRVLHLRRRQHPNPPLRFR